MTGDAPGVPEPYWWVFGGVTVIAALVYGWQVWRGRPQLRMAEGAGRAAWGVVVATAGLAFRGLPGSARALMVCGGLLMVAGVGVALLWRRPPASD